MSQRVQKPTQMLVRETHEPPMPQDRPEDHMAVTLTGDDEAECIEVKIHRVRLFLHPTTARELSNMLVVRIGEWNVTGRTAGVPGV